MAKSTRRAKAKSGTRKAAAKRTARRPAAARGTSPSPTVLLVTQTQAGLALSAKERATDRMRVTRFVAKAGAKCVLFAAKGKGGPQQLVSLVWGLSPANSRRLAAVIGETGYASAEILVGIRKS